MWGHLSLFTSLCTSLTHITVDIVVSDGEYTLVVGAPGASVATSASSGTGESAEGTGAGVALFYMPRLTSSPLSDWQLTTRMSLEGSGARASEGAGTAVALAPGVALFGAPQYEAPTPPQEPGQGGGGSDPTPLTGRVQAALAYVATAAVSELRSSDEVGFGYCAAMGDTGQVAVLGAPWHNLNGKRDSGAVYVYTTINPAAGDWQRTALLSRPGAEEFDYFGHSVATAQGGSVVLVGAPQMVPYYSTSGAWTGGAVLFRYRKAGSSSLSNPAQGGGSWWMVDLAPPYSLPSGAQFGATVALSNDGSLAAVGSASYDWHDSDLYQWCRGGVYVFRATGSSTGSWEREGFLYPRAYGEQLFQVSSLAIIGTTVLAGNRDYYEGPNVVFFDWIPSNAPWHDDDYYGGSGNNEHDANGWTRTFTFRFSSTYESPVLAAEGDGKYVAVGVPGKTGPSSSCELLGSSCGYVSVLTRTEKAYWWTGRCVSVQSVIAPWPGSLREDIICSGCWLRVLRFGHTHVAHEQRAVGTAACGSWQHLRRASGDRVLHRRQ